MRARAPRRKNKERQGRETESGRKGETWKTGRKTNKLVNKSGIHEGRKG